MGKLVALNTNNEEKKLKTEQPIATTVAQGRRGKLMQTGSTRAPVSSPPTVYRTSPVKTAPVTQQNVVMPKNQSKLGKATFSGNRTPGKQQKYSVGKGIAGATMKGINQAAQGIADTLALAEDVALSPFELVSGQQLGDLSDSGLANKLQRRIRNEGQEIEDKYAENVERGGKAAEIFDKYGASTVAAVPQAVAAVLTSGASLGATSTTLAKTAATEMAPSIANTIRNSVLAMGKDPQYWLSFSQVVGSSYEQALDDMEKAGVDNNTARTKAALYATGNGLMNAAVEVGGGIQTLPEQLKHGSAAWKAWLESAFEEGKEEVVQGILERATQNVAYKKGNLLASMRDENAILNPRTSAEEFLGGAVVGGVLGGGQVGANAALQSLARFDNSLGENGRKAIRGSYQEGKDTAEHVKDFIPAYNAGVEGKANPNPTNETAYAGYVAGQNDAKAEARKKTFAQESDGGSGLVYDDYVSREMDSATADEINTVAKALGVRVRMADAVRGGTANGVIEGNEIRIAKDAQDPVMQVVGHEWTHRVQELAPEQYTAFRDAIMEDPDVAEAANILHEQYNRMGVEISTDEALDEAAANYAGEMIANTDVLNEFIRKHSEDRTLLEKLRDAIREIVGKLTGKAKQQAQTAEGLLQQAFEAAAQNSKNAATEGGTRYSIDPYFSENVREWYEEGQNAGERFTLGSTGDVLQGLGAIESDIYMNGDKISRILSDHPEMTIEEIRKIPELLEDPVLILKSKGRGTSKANSRVVLYGTMKAQNGEPVMAVLDLRPSENGFVLDDMQKVNSAYTKKNPANFVTGSDVLYADKKRTVPLLRQFGLTITSRELLRNGSIGSISYENGVVKLDGVPLSEVTGENVKRYSLKIDSEGRELTEQQQEYFKDSKARDEQGRLLTLYHGTTAYGEFTKFRRGRSGWLGPGIYLTSDLSYAERYANSMGKGNGHLYELYANVTNPLVVHDGNPVPEILFAAYGRNSVYKNRSAKQSIDAMIITAADIKKLREKGYDGIRWDFGKSTELSVFSPEQIKNIDNKAPTRNPDIRYSLKEYTDEEKKQHRKDADEYFGHTYKWSETGYILTNGKKLDFSGRHEGGPGGYRTVDHRDIRDALGDDYGGSDYSGSMVQFMSEGNIRISPESSGINLSVMPTKNQLDSLSDFISHNRGEVILDLDTPDGQTVSSTEYPRGTHADKVLADIKAYFEDGTTPQVSSLAQFLSLKGTENAQEIAALKRENEALRQRVDYWKGQTRRSDGVRTDSKSVEKAAKELTRRYGAEIDSGEIAGDLANLYDYIARGGDETGELTYTEARSRADSIAQRIAESAIAKDDEVYREYSELRKYLKDTKITLSAEDAAGITDYADFRRSLFGKVNLGKGEHTNVDQVYSELAESYPEFFSETRENNVSDQISRIADVTNELYSVSEYNPFEGYMGQAVSAISNDVMERFFDLPQAKKTFADVQAEKLDAAKASGRKAAADAKLAGQMAQGRTDAVKLRHTQEALQKARAQQAEKLDALKDRYREKDATRREGQKRRELRAKITRHAKDLSKKLLRPTDAKHIPENMRSAVAAVLNSINQESAYTVDESGKHVYDGSGTPTQRTQAFEALRDQYQDILSGREKDGDDLVIDPSLLGTDGSDGLLGQVIGMKDKRLSELTREELGTMWKTIRAVEKSVSTAGKVLSKSKFETTKQMADAFKTDVSTRRKKLGNNTTISLETPYTFFAHYGETGKSIYRMLRNAQDSQEIMARDIAEKTRKVLGDELGEAGFKDIAGKAIHGDLKGALRDARGSAIGKWEAETHDITVANGGKLILTTPQIMELYLLSKRKQALGHLLGGGVIQPEIKSAETGRTKVRRGTQQVFLTDGDIERITGKLTDEQKRVADGLQELTATTLAKYGNDASMQAYGYRKFTERNYWPIKSAAEGLHSTQEKDSGNVRSIKNIGMAQQVTPNANNAVELRSVFDTFADHASDMIDYAAWLAPMEDANRFFNFQYRNDAGNKTGVSVKGLLDEKGGKGAQQYWTKLMGDIQNGISGKDFEPSTNLISKSVGKFKAAKVGANIRVVIQQPTAFFRAAAVLDPKDMAKGMTGGVTKGSGWEKALEHSPIAMRKDVGSFDIASPYTLKERFYGKEGVTNKLNDLAGAAAGKADAVTWGNLWNACEWQVKREKPDIRAGSNEFYSAVNDVFSDMIDQTQVVDGILQRSNIMRSKQDLAQQATAFMGEPIMTLNVLLRSYDNFRYEENPAKRSKALKTLGRAATALVVTDVVNALAQSIVDAIRDDDRDKDYWEKFFSAFTGVEGDEDDALKLILHVALDGNVGSNLNPLGKYPYVKDGLSILQGFSVSRPDMNSFVDFVKAANTFVKSIEGNGAKTRNDAVSGLIAATAQFSGLPIPNVRRDVMATIRTIAQASGSLGFQYEVEKFSYNLENSSNKSRFIGILYDALEQGDYATYEHVRRDLMEQMGLDGENIQSSLKTRYKKETESEANYSFPQKSLDLLGIRGKYAYDSGEGDEKFSAADLNAGSYSKYETQKSETYRAQADKATSSGAFSRLSDEGKDKALGYVESYAEAVALKENSGGQYEITTKWIQNAQEAQKQYRIDPGVFAACKVAASECETLKDKDGDSIDYSKGLQIMGMLFRSGLNEQQRTAMYEYLDVPKKIRHWNRARVDEQLAIARKKAA